MPEGRLGKQQRPSKYWIVLKTKQVASTHAITNVRKQGFELLHLQYRAPMIRGARPRAPLFPYYLLVRVDETQQQDWKVLCSTKGVSYVITMSDLPSIIPTKFVQGLKRAVRDSADGYYPDPSSDPPLFTRGDVVCGTRGLFEDKYGTYVGLAGNSANRVRVLFSILGREAEFEVSATDLDRRASAAA